MFPLMSYGADKIIPNNQMKIVILSIPWMVFFPIIIGTPPTEQN